MTMDGFVTGTYFISFMHLAGIPLATIAVILMLSRVADALGVLLSGPLADFCKRRMTAYTAVGLTTLLSYPFVLAVLSKRIALVMALQIPISFFGIGVLHGLAPSALAALIGQDVFHRWYYVPICYAFYCAVAMVALLFLRETRDVRLQDLDQSEADLAFTPELQKALADRPGGGLG
jgi:MFS transporter, MHS family, shikimate and dehydroshikimate transport protein